MDLQIKAIRTRRKMRQEDVADALGMPVRRYGSYERGERKLSLRDAALIADVLDCTLDELAGRQWPRAAGGDPAEQQLVDDYRASTPQWRRNISMTAKAAAAESKEEAEPGRDAAAGLQG